MRVQSKLTPNFLHDSSRHRDVVVGEGRGVRVVADRGVLGVQAEGVEAHRVQDLVAALPPVAGDHVVQREHLGVAHVQVTARGRGTSSARSASRACRSAPRRRRRGRAAAPPTPAATSPAPRRRRTSRASVSAVVAGAVPRLIVFALRSLVEPVRTLVPDMKKPLAGRGGRATWWTSARLSKKQGALHGAHRIRNVLVLALRYRLGSPRERSEQVRRLAGLAARAGRGRPRRPGGVRRRVGGHRRVRRPLRPRRRGAGHAGRVRRGVPAAARRGAARLRRPPGLGAPRGDLARRAAGVPQPHRRRRRPRRADPDHRPPRLRPRRRAPAGRRAPPRRAARRSTTRTGWSSSGTTTRRRWRGHAPRRSRRSPPAARPRRGWSTGPSRAARWPRRWPSTCATRSTRWCGCSGSCTARRATTSGCATSTPTCPRGTPRGSRRCCPVPTWPSAPAAAFAWQDELLAELAAG